MPIPRYRPQDGPALLSAGFRPFFLFAGFCAAVAIPIWLLVFSGAYQLPTQLPPVVWHVHEMIFGYGAAVVAGFLLTASGRIIPSPASDAAADQKWERPSDLKDRLIVANAREAVG